VRAPAPTATVSPIANRDGTLHPVHQPTATPQPSSTATPAVWCVSLPAILATPSAYFVGAWEREPSQQALPANGPLYGGHPCFGYPNDMRNYFLIDARGRESGPYPTGVRAAPVSTGVAGRLCHWAGRSTVANPACGPVTYPLLITPAAGQRGDDP
jgi:hypothetical protein